jgi:hypothetical protein
MRDQLRQYVELLFAGAADCEDIKQEILQNTLDRYDDLIAEGKVPEAAYRLAITGIGDINEILGSKSREVVSQRNSSATATADTGDTIGKKLLRALAIGLYIVSLIPLFLLSDHNMPTMGLCCTLVIVAIATVMILLGAKKESADETQEERMLEFLTPQQELKKSISKLISVIALVAFFVVSFLTGAWYITWLIFPIAAAVKGLVSAILDLKEVDNYEN